jgi:hypothetical protein
MIRIPKRRIADALIWLLAVALLLWLGDWTVWRIRVWRGGGYDTVQVNQILLIPLKNHKMEADAQSTADQPCARSIFPHGGDDPCWWLRRHATVWQQASLHTQGAPHLASEMWEDAQASNQSRSSTVPGNPTSRV